MDSRVFRTVHSTLQYLKNYYLYMYVRMTYVCIYIYTYIYYMFMPFKKNIKIV